MHPRIQELLVTSICFQQHVQGFGPFQARFRLGFGLLSGRAKSKRTKGQWDSTVGCLLESAEARAARDAADPSGGTHDGGVMLMKTTRVMIVMMLVVLGINSGRRSG